MAYNQELCERKHQEIEHELAQERETMARICEILRGNGKSGLIARVDSIEQILVRQESVFWRILTPALPMLYGAIMAAIIYYLKG